MTSLVQPGKYGVTNTDDKRINGFYVIKFISEVYTLKNNTTIDGKIISAGELFVNAKYLCSMQENSNWYWKQQSMQHNIIFSTPTIIHTCLDVLIMTDVQDIPKTFCNIIQ